MSEENYKPTNELRYVVRTEPAPQYGEHVCINKQVLQQKWESIYVGVDDEWRDVPIVGHNSLFTDLCRISP